jgi:hypothetical protein
MEITRIKAPKFRVGRYVLNEYEFRNLQLEVALGVKPAGIKVTDAQGNRAVIEENGCLSDSIEGLALAGDITLEILRANHRKGE